MRGEMPGLRIPHFDPEDGGIDAEVLFLLKSPGSGAKKSCFVSRDNPDEFARLGKEVNAEAGLERKRTVSWNLIPWAVDSKEIRVLHSEAERALEYLGELLSPEMLPRLKHVVLFGAFARDFKNHVSRIRDDVEITTCPMPSHQVFNTDPENRAHVVNILRGVAEAL
jgi:hypothetical protein